MLFLHGYCISNDSNNEFKMQLIISTKRQQKMKKNLKDNGGRRSGQDRRMFFYAAYLPERRTGSERRSGDDRRIELDSAYLKGPSPERRQMMQDENLAASL